LIEQINLSFMVQLTYMKYETTWSGCDGQHSMPRGAFELVYQAQQPAACVDVTVLTANTAGPCALIDPQLNPPRT
jgi:hypothetical protein